MKERLLEMVTNGEGRLSVEKVLMMAVIALLSGGGGSVGTLYALSGRVAAIEKRLDSFATDAEVTSAINAFAIAHDKTPHSSTAEAIRRQDLEDEQLRQMLKDLNSKVDRLIEFHMGGNR